jgi:methionyl-tRNA formyltransferase
MRIVYFANNRLGGRVARRLVAEGAEIVGLVLHPEERRRAGDELVEAAPSAARFDATQLEDPAVVAQLAALEPELGVSVLFGYLLRRPVLDVFPAGCVNLHPALLPYNRGAYPNVWPILDGSPAGTTLHYVDEGVDTGDVVAQRPVEVTPVDTGETLYRRLEDASYELFFDAWPALRDGTAGRTPQPRDVGSTHRVRDVEPLDAIDPEAQYAAGALIDLLRARTFSGYPGAYVVRDGRKILLRLELAYADE